MEKIKLLTIAVFALLILNLGTLGFLIFAPKPGMGMHGPHRNPKILVIRRLGFDKAQQGKFEKLIEAHHAKIMDIEGKIHDSKNRLYLQLLKTNVDDKYKDSVINVLADCQKQIEETHFSHFRDIKKICRPDQLDKFYDLTEDLSHIFSKMPDPGHEQ